MVAISAFGEDNAAGQSGDAGSDNCDLRFHGMIYVQLNAASYKLTRHGGVEPGRIDGANSWRANEFRAKTRWSFIAGHWRNWALSQMRAAIWRRQKSYDGRGREIVTYIVDRNINYTNVCNVYCKFCAFYRTEKDDDHYVLSFEQIDQKLDELTAAGGVQILMQGGHHPKLSFDWYLDLLHHIREKYPHINIHGFSPPEFQHFAEVFAMPLREVICTIQGSRARVDPGRRWRDSGRSRAGANLAA